MFCNPTHSELAAAPFGDGDDSSTAASRSAQQFAALCWCFHTIWIWIIPTMLVASVRTTPITPKTMGMTIVSAVLDTRGLSPFGSTFRSRPMQDANVDDEFTDMLGVGVLRQTKCVRDSRAPPARQFQLICCTALLLLVSQHACVIPAFPTVIPALTSSATPTTQHRLQQST
jgi:hypothetical protein